MDERAEDRSAATRSLRLSTPIADLNFVHRSRIAQLEKLGLHRLSDILFFFPRAYQEVISIAAYDGLVEDQTCSVVGTIESIDVRYLDGGRSMFGTLLKLESGGYVRLIWFNQDYLQKTLRRGVRLIATGAPKTTGISWQMRHPTIQILGADEPPPPPRPLSIYPLTEGLQQGHIRKIVEQVLLVGSEQVPEALPDSLRQQEQLLSIVDALRAIHQPESMDEANAARRRFIFQELLVYQLAIAIKRHRRQTSGQAHAFQPSGLIHARILNRLGFELTEDQKLAIDAIGIDMAKTTPMNRLIQGDVGSGKTVIAQYAMLLAAAHRAQSAFMVPTELLAIQHAKRLTESLSGSQCHVESLTGALQGRERRELLERIALGTVDIVVGTQALLSDKVQFAKLGLVVIDEQHKFGVAQRAALQNDESQPHYLLLSATPIPRTLTMLAMGDMDVSVLRDKPPGRAPVHSYLGKNHQRDSWWEFVRKQLRLGRQAYVVVPRVSNENSEESHAADQVFADLCAGEFRDFRLAILHGGLEAEVKAQVLSDFAEGRIDLLVTTTVIEVGIDIANATVMTILDADRLGLAQLHQLRGRVSRGSTPGFVCAFPSQGLVEVDNQRLDAFVKTNDGFELAELDWSLRGPGNLLGTTQTGLPAFRIADLVRDQAIASHTYELADRIVAHDPELASPDWTRVRDQVYSKHGKMLDFGTVG